MIGAGDIFKAYDTVDHETMTKAYDKTNVDRLFTAACIREVRNSQGKIRFPSLEPSRFIKRTRSLFQGDPSAPIAFNITLDTMVVKPFLKHARAMHWGFEAQHEDLDTLQDSLSGERQAKRTRYNTERIPLLLFADNFWLIGTSPRQLTMMARKWHELLHQSGFGVDLSDWTWTSTALEHEASEIRLPNLWPTLLAKPSDSAELLVNHEPRSGAIKVLGSMISATGDCTCEVEHRIVKAWASFHKHRELLMARSGSAYQRLDFLRRVVLPCLLFNIGTCHLSKAQLRRLRGVEDKMMRRVFRWYFKDEFTGEDPKQDVSDYMAVMAHKLDVYRQRRGYRRWDEEALVRSYTWAGHVARFSKYNANRLALKALCYRDINYLRTLERLYGQQCHGRRIRVWRWERQFSAILGDHWQSIALEGESWEDSMNYWLIRRQH